VTTEDRRRLGRCEVAVTHLLSQKLASSTLTTKEVVLEKLAIADANEKPHRDRTSSSPAACVARARRGEDVVSSAGERRNQ